MGIVFKNNAKTTLSSAVNNSTTTIPVTDGSVFPAVNLSGAGTFFLLTLDDESNNEIVKVTSCSGASGNINLTVIRAQEGTTARAFSSGHKAELRFTSGTVDEIRSDNSVHTNIFTTANNSTTDFTLSDEVANENDLVVFIDGVFQAHNSFSVSGTTLTLATAPESGRVVTVYSIKGSRSASNVALATMTGDNSDTTLTLPVEPINENSVQVFFDGVYQNKDSFSISGTTLTFGVAPPTGVAVEALIFTKLAINTSSILSDTDADTKVQVEESSDEDKIRFDTGGTERVIIDSSGLEATKIGVGITPIVPCEILSTGATSTALRVLKSGSDDSTQNNLFSVTEISGHGRLSIHDTSQNEDIRFDSNGDSYFNGGNLGVGTTSPDEKLDVAGNVVVNNGGFYKFGDGTVRIYGETSTDIMSFVTNDLERMRIDSSGTVLIGMTSDNYLATDDGIQLKAAGNIRIGGSGTSARNVMSFVNNTGGTPAEVGGIQTSGSSTSFNTSSDYRLKENVNYEFNALSRVAQLKPARFNFIVDADTTVDGFIAHEVSDIVPEAISGTKDAVDDEGNPRYQGIDQSKLVPLLTKAIQELSAKVEELEGKIE